MIKLKRRLVKLGIMLSFTLFLIQVQAQHQELSEKPAIWKEQLVATDTHKLADIFKKGSVSGHFRSFFMSTNNAKNLKDDHALAMGGGLRFETSSFHGFRFGLSGVYIFHVFSSDILKPDSVTRLPNRYEIGLFDIDPRDGDLNMSRLEEFYISWQHKGLKVTLGKQHINTPFINLQDGRMRPTAVDGIWLDWRQTSGLQLSGGFLYGMAPRSTSKYYDIGTSIGLYPAGVNPAGVPSSYKGKLDLKGIAYLGVNGKFGKNNRWSSWQMLVPDLFYISMYQTDLEYSISSAAKLLLGAQLIYQQQSGSGGVEESINAYIEKNAGALAFGGRFGYAIDGNTLQVSATRITGRGRYLMPREWGRDPFYTFMPRERNEGYGDLTALVLQFMGKTGFKGLKYTAACGYFDLPNVKNFALNKYGMPSYIQAYIDARYSFGGKLKGLESQVLYLHKWKMGEDYNNPRYIYNKVDMSNLNVVLNFYF